jgi:hypothetical protein
MDAHAKLVMELLQISATHSRRREATIIALRSQGAAR